MDSSPFLHYKSQTLQVHRVHMQSKALKCTAKTLSVREKQHSVSESKPRNKDTKNNALYAVECYYSYNVYATESAADIAMINQIAISSILDYPTSKKKHSIHHLHKDMQCDHTFSCLKKLKYLSMADDCTISAVPKSIRTVTE